MTVSASVPPLQAMPDTPCIYADYQATTPLDARVREAMLPYFADDYGNPHSRDNQRGRMAEAKVEEARAQIAEVLSADSREIIFTSGATEANNLAILGAAQFHLHETSAIRRHIVTAATEHMSVLAPVRHLERLGFEVTVLPVKPDGLLDVEQFKAAIREDTLLASVMAVNNEIGVIQDIAAIGAACREKGVLLHVDAAQGFGRISLDMRQFPVDLLSISAHKIYGPMGIGALYIRRKPRVRIAPIQFGGAQEGGLRSGTVPLPLAVGFGKAAKIMHHEGLQEEKGILALRQQFLQTLEPAKDAFIVNGSLEQRIAGNISLCFPHGDILPQLTGMEVSRGSACNSGGNAPSYVIRALDVGDDIARTAIRFGFGRFTTEVEVQMMADTLLKALRSQ